MNHAIELSRVTVRLAGRTLIDRIDLRAEAGRLTAVIGPNGSGKSTLLKAICGDLQSEGAIAINGHDLRRLKPWQAAGLRAVLPQATVLSFPFTVREVVALGASAGRPGPEARDLEWLPERALAEVDLDGFAGRMYGELSGGEQQRVQLARTLCQVWSPVLDGVPRYLLLDEPVSSLDIRHQLLIMAVARRFADAGGGVIAVLHDLNLTAMFADRVLVLGGGRAAAFGTPREVLSDGTIAQVFSCDLRVGQVPPAPMPFVLPQSARL